MNETLYFLSKTVDEAIHKSMFKFSNLGSQAKAMHNSDASERELAAVHDRMRSISDSLKPFAYRVSQLYPDMKGLLDLLSC